jgi:opacity protein-like surface antigen
MRTFVQLAVSILLGAYAMGAAAQSAPPRGGKWEFTVQPQYTESADLSGSSGSRAQIQGAWGFGFGFGYNFNNHLALGGELTWAQADYTRTTAPGVGNPGSSFIRTGTIETSTLRMNGTWNLLASDFTPFATGGIGSTYVDTNIPDGPTQCWVDPWYGTYCGTPTKSNTYFSYNAGVGLRWDVNREFFLRGVYTRQWIDVGGGLGSPAFDQYRIDFGFKH